MNSAQIISQVAESLKTESLKKNDTLKQYYSVVIDLKQDPIRNMNWNECLYFWSSPQQGEYLAGFGVCKSFDAAGENRFQRLQQNFQTFLKHWDSNQKQSIAQELPIAFCAFAFNSNDKMVEMWQDFPNSELMIPLIVFDIKTSAKRLIINIDTKNRGYEQQVISLVEKILHPNPKKKSNFNPQRQLIGNPTHQKNSWINQVEQALNNISQNKTNKLVPSRHVRYQQKQALPIKKLMERLSQVYPSCHILAIRNGDSELVAASPERLLKVAAQHVFCNAIGGTLKRSKRQSITNLLRHNNQGMDKLLHEHAIIVEHIYNVLDDFCETLKLPTAPGIMKLKHLLHLETPVQGQLKSTTSPLSLAEKLHPTPAVAGFPVPQALQWLKHNESHNRGLYTGAMGWLTPSGSGELSVILRCALLSHSGSKHYLDLFAGAGIVEHSDPEEEWDETELKLETILGILE